jgi:hypothetical protein
MPSDVRIWDGAAWVSLRGPAGPSAVSTNAGQLAKLGTDNLILVSSTDLDARYVNVAGDTMTGNLVISPAAAQLTVGSTGNTTQTLRSTDGGNALLNISSGASTGQLQQTGAAFSFTNYASGGTTTVNQVGNGLIRFFANSVQTLAVSGTGISVAGNITSTGTAHNFQPNSILVNAISGLKADSLSDVTVTTPVVGQVLRWNGTAFVNAALGYADLSGAPAAATVAPLADAASASIGTSTAYARQDHVHPLPTAAQVGAITQAQADARYVELTGDWMSGPLALGGTAAFTTTSPLDIDATTYRVRQPKTPASQTDIGEQGTVCWDTAYLYCCVAPNQWRRQAWSDWSGAVTGAAWSPLTTASSPQFAVSFGGGTFVADVGKWSVDGANWYAGFGLPTGNSIARAAFGSGTFVTVAKSSSGGFANFYTSSDGKAWTTRTVAVGGTSNRTQARGVAFGASRFVALMNTTGSSVENVLPRHSIDGITWTASAAPSGLAANTLSDITGVAFGSGLFVAVGNANSGGLATNRYLTSPDGITWTARSLPLSLSWNDVAFGNGRFTVIAPGLVALTSIDGINWTQVAMPASADWETMTYGGGRWIAVAPTTTTAAISSDGISWATMPLPAASAWNGIATNGTVFVATNGTNSPAILTPNPQLVTYFPISASRTLVASDASATVANVTTGATPVTLTIPTNAAVAFPIGTSITVMDASSSAVTVIKADAGVTLNWSGKLVGSTATVLGGVAAEVQIPGPLSQVVLRKVAADNWTILY